jgi:hypothetical protein
MKKMSKIEYLLSGIVLGTFFPGAIMIFFWWLPATLTIYRIIYIPDLYIMISSLTGLSIGIIIDILVLKKIIPKFYDLNKYLLIITYLFCSAFAVSSFMGLPIGNFFLGLIAGLYVGRKCYHLNKNHNSYLQNMKTVSNFTAFITSFEGLLIGLLMLNDKSVINSTNQFLGIQIFSANQYRNVLIIILLCILLYVMQFILTKAAVNLSYSIHTKSD